MRSAHLGFVYCEEAVGSRKSAEMDFATAMSNGWSEID